MSLALLFVFLVFMHLVAASYLAYVYEHYRKLLPPRKALLVELTWNSDVRYTYMQRTDLKPEIGKNLGVSPWNRQRIMLHPIETLSPDDPTIVL